MSDVIKYNKNDSKEVRGKRSSFASLKDAIRDAEELAEIVINSSTFGSAFEKYVNELDENGKPVLDNDGNKVKVKVKSKEDVIACIVLGQELGISPMAAISMGHTLNAQAYAKVLKGKKLGLDPMSSIQLIHSITNSSGVTAYSTGVHLIAGCLLKNNIKFKILKDYEPIYGYVDLKNNLIEFDSKSHVVVSADTDPKALKEALDSGKKPVLRKVVNYITSIEFNREGFEKLVIDYTIQDAIDAGLYKGRTTEGIDLDGKANWNNHPKTHLRNRALTIGGRIIAADYLDGMYSNEEVMEFTNYEVVEEEKELDISNLADDSANPSNQ